MCRALHERSYWLTEMNTRKTLSTVIYFLFQSPKRSPKSCFALSLNYVGLCEERSSKEVKDNFQSRAILRKIVKKSMFHFTIVNLVNKGVLYFLIITREGRGERLSWTFLKIGRKCLDFGKTWKGALILAIYELNFSKCFPLRPYSFCCRRAIWGKIMEVLKALTLIIICTKFS